MDNVTQSVATAVSATSATFAPHTDVAVERDYYAIGRSYLAQSGHSVDDTTGQIVRCLDAAHLLRAVREDRDGSLARAILAGSVLLADCGAHSYARALASARLTFPTEPR